MVDYRKLLLSFCASLTFCDHIGDVSNAVRFVLEKLDMPAEVLNADWEQLGKELGKLRRQDALRHSIGGRMSMTWTPDNARPKRGPLSDPAPANWYGESSQQHKRIGQTETDDEKRAEWIEEVWQRLEEGRA